LASAEKAEQLLMLESCPSADFLPLAVELRKLCYETWMTAPEKTFRIVSAAELLKNKSVSKEIKAIADWICGIGALTGGEMKRAVRFLESAGQKFRKLTKPIDAAETEVSKMYALAVLGLYEKAVECGLLAREIFLEHGELFSAGKIEHNLGNIYQRQDRYREAEEILLLAKTRFSPETDRNKFIQIENCIAMALSYQHKFRASEEIYEQTLRLSKDAGLEVTQAEIESNLGYLSLFQGLYDRALSNFESSRRRYTAMKMRHQTAIAEQEMADAYLELNLIPEAENLYKKIIPVFSDLDMKAEKARALAYFAKTLMQNGQTAEVHELLSESRALYVAEKNAVGEALVALTEAQLYFAENEFETAENLAGKAEKTLKKGGAWSRALQARLVRGNAKRNLGKKSEARRLVKTALRDAESMPQIRLSCLTSLGLLALDDSDFQTAQKFFFEAIELTEKLRAPLASEDFRTAFVTDKLMPYREIVKIYLAENAVEKAFQFTERSRSRALLDALDGDFANFEPQDEFEEKLLAKTEKLRGELNWFYRQLSNPLKSVESNLTAVNEAIQERESEMSEIIRQISLRFQTYFPTEFHSFEPEKIQNLLNENTALVEFSAVDGEYFAFVLTDREISVVKCPATEKEIGELLDQFRSQIDVMRKTGAKNAESLWRTRQILHILYVKLFKPMENLVGFRRLIIVPHQDLNYVPFHALFDGFGYVIENREIIYAPSASIWAHCQNSENLSSEKILLFGTADEKIPQVRGEIESLKEIFPEAESFLNEKAMRRTLFEKAEKANILHLACHGKFRTDNPLFSSLQLGDGFLTVRDTYNLKLKNCRLAVLSACETGISKVAKGEELLGLIRGFLSAGVPSLVLSFWTVEDESTAELMKIFYEHLKKNLAVSTALRLAQCEMLEKYPHPFFWSPFFVVGRG